MLRTIHHCVGGISNGIKQECNSILKNGKGEMKLFLFDDEMVIWKAPPQPKSMKDLL